MLTEHPHTLPTAEKLEGAKARKALLSWSAHASEGRKTDDQHHQIRRWFPVMAKHSKNKSSNCNRAMAAAVVSAADSTPGIVLNTL